MTDNITETGFFDERHDEVVSQDGQTVVVKYGHDTIGDYQLEAYHEQDRWVMDVAAIWDGDLLVNYKRSP